MKTLKPEEFPVLTTAQHHELQGLEYEFSNALDADSRTFIQSEKTRTYAVSFFDAFFDFYKPKISADAKLCEAARLQSYVRVMTLLQERNDYIWSRFRDKEYEAHQLVTKTLDDHAKDVASKLPRLTAPVPHLNVPVMLAPPTPTVAEQLKALKMESEITYERLATALGVDITTVQRHLSGKLNPRAEKIALYEEAFGKQLGRLVKIKRGNNAI